MNLTAGGGGVRETEEDFKWERKSLRQGNKDKDLLQAVEGSCLGFWFVLRGQ